MENKRDFKRYSCQSACEIRIDSDVYKAVVVDYSDGLGVIAEKAPLLKTGIVADIRILNSDEEIKGQVAWVKEMDNEVRVGFKRLGNLKGELKDFSLTDLLIGIQRGTKTGNLEIVSGSISKRIYIKNGDMISADSNVNDDRLGELLVKEGTITIRQFNEASERLLETGEKLGKIFVDLSYMTPRELYQAVRHQIDEIILSLFTIEEGTFEFKEGPLTRDDLITLNISAANIIYRGIKRVKNFIYASKMFPSPDSVPYISQNPMNIFQSISLDHRDKQILYAINGQDSLKKILSLFPFNDFETLKTISAFLSIGIITINKQDEAPAMISANDILKKEDNENPEEFLTKVEEFYIQCECADYYDFLGIDKKATEEEIQRAYYRLAKHCHPDRHFTFPGHDIKGKLIKIFTYATEANNILLDPERRERYDERLLMELKNISGGEETVQATHENLETENDNPEKRVGDNDIKGVIGDFHQSSGADPLEESETLYELGVAYMEMGLVEDAITEFRRASNDHSKRVKCIKKIAGYYINEGDYQQAIEEFMHLVSELSPDNEEYLDVKYELADAYIKNKEYENALKLFDEIQSENAGYRDIAHKVETANTLLSDG
jgi:curved DNA-binding protein CbpA